MAIQYESEWEGTTSYTNYPFKIKIVDFIVAITIISSKRCYLKYIVKDVDFYTLHFYQIDETFLGGAACSYTGGIFKILNGTEIIGYVETVVDVVENKIFTFEQSEIWKNISCMENFNETIVEFEEGYNFGIQENIEFDINRGAGRGEYCGKPIEYDGIYTVNGIGPDENGNLEWLERDFFRIVEDPENNRIYFDTIIPDDLCLRHGMIGPKGPEGPPGSDGKDGLDALDLPLSFDEICRVESSVEGICSENDVIWDCDNCDEKDE